VVCGKVVADERLTTVLVDTLEDLNKCQRPVHRWGQRSKHLVCSGISKTWEQGEESAGYRRRGLVLENDGVELRNGGNLEHAICKRVTLGAPYGDSTFP